MEWSGSAIPLQEYQTAYGDGYVQAYVAVPDLPTPFMIRLRSHGYIAPGLAMYVYIDGEYQVNRFRQNLKIPDGTTTRRQTEVDFLVRQKEEMLEDGTFQGKQWRFENLNIVTAPKEHAGPLAVFNGEYVGTVEVVVLRCYPGEVSNSAENSSLASSPQSPKKVKLPPEPKSPKEPKKATPPSSSDDDSSSSSGDSTSDDGPPKATSSTVDGADERPHGALGSLVFGGDMAWDDDHPPRKNSPRKLGGISSGSFKRGYIPRSQRGSPAGKKRDNSWDGSNISQHFNDDWGKYSSLEGRNSPEQEATAGRSSKENSPTLSKHEASPKGIDNPSTKNSPQVNVPVPPGHSSPAIIINVNHGTVSPASIPPSVHAPTVNSWVLPEEQNDKSDEKRSSTSSGSSGSKNGSDNFRGHRKKESWAMNMPGGWGASNVGSHANSTSWNDNQDEGAQPDRGWNNDNDKQQENNNGWNNNGESSAQPEDSWGATTGGAQETNTGWNNNGSGGSGGNGENQETNTGWNNNNNGNGEHKENTGWGNNGNSENKDRGEWNNNGSGDNNDNSGWNNKGTTAAPTSGWSWGKVGTQNQKEEPQTWGGATEKKNGWDMPKKDNSEPEGKATSEKPTGIPKYTMDFTQSPNVMSTTSQDKPADPNTWPSNAATLNDAQGQTPVLAPPFQPKPYWTTWNHLPEIPEEKKPPEPILEPPPPPAEPVPGVPIDVATRNNMSHQVHTDRPAPYMHRTSPAKHMDTLEAPYAVFIFKYRSSAILEKMLNITLTEPEAEQKRRLSTLSKDELIEHYLRAKANASTPSAPSTVVPASFHSNDNNNNGIARNGNTNPAAGLDFSNALSQKLNQLSINTPNTASTNPSHHWGRSNNAYNSNNPTNGWNVLPSSPPSNPVTGWFNNGGGDPVTSPPHGSAAPIGSPTNWGDGGQATAGANASGSQNGGSRGGNANANGGGSQNGGSWGGNGNGNGNGSANGNAGAGAAAVDW